jgi:hypothetical protein
MVTKAPPIECDHSVVLALNNPGDWRICGCVDVVVPLVNELVVVGIVVELVVVGVVVELVVVVGVVVELMVVGVVVVSTSNLFLMLVVVRTRPRGLVVDRILPRGRRFVVVVGMVVVVEHFVSYYFLLELKSFLIL